MPNPLSIHACSSVSIIPPRSGPENSGIRSTALIGNSCSAACRASVIAAMSTDDPIDAAARTRPSKAVRAPSRYPASAGDIAVAFLMSDNRAASRRDNLKPSRKPSPPSAASRRKAKSCRSGEFFNRMRRCMSEPETPVQTEPAGKFGGLDEADTTVWMRILGLDDETSEDPANQER